MQSVIDEWLPHFQKNDLESVSIPWDYEEEIAPEEVAVIADSVAAFQLGEYSEGKGLLGAAREFASLYSLEHLVELTTLFVKEEQNHAGMLKRFMELHGIPLKKKVWTDSVFRFLRKNVSFELSVTVLITAEMIALTYYKALKQATTSKVLQAICEKNLIDEMAHVSYESALLHRFYRNQPPLKRTLAFWRHGMLFAATIPVVWFTHRKVFLQGGYSFFHYHNACWDSFRRWFGR